MFPCKINHAKPWMPQDISFNEDFENGEFGELFEICLRINAMKLL
jgi:hypothetical protein